MPPCATESAQASVFAGISMTKVLENTIRKLKSDYTSASRRVIDFQFEPNVLKNTATVFHALASLYALHHNASQQPIKSGFILFKFVRFLHNFCLKNRAANNTCRYNLFADLVRRFVFTAPLYELANRLVAT